MAGLRIAPTPFGLVMIGVALAIPAVSSASADPQVTGLVWAAVVAMIAVSVFWPLIGALTVRCSVSLDVTDVEVGQSIDLDLSIRGTLPPIELRIGGPEGLVVQYDGGDARGVAPFVATARGQWRTVDLYVVARAPLGMGVARRRLTCALDRPLFVAPRPANVGGRVGPVTTAGVGATTRQADRRGDEVRSVRPYRPGDPSHLVHWPSTARAGELMIRELEPPAEVGVAIVVDLGADEIPPNAGPASDAVEAAVSVAAGRALAVMEAGGMVMLCTAGPAGPLAREVGSRLDLGRRLAVATFGPPGRPPAGWLVDLVTP